MKRDQRFRVAQNVLTREIEGQLMVLADSGDVHALNGVGAEIWHLVEAGHSLQEIITEIARIYEVAITQVEDDTASFVESLLAEGYIVTNP